MQTFKLHCLTMILMSVFSAVKKFSSILLHSHASVNPIILSIALFCLIGLSSSYYWIGAKRYTHGGQFVQTFGSTFDDTSPLWKDGEPSYYGEVCALADRTSSYQLRVVGCSSTVPFVCQIQHFG